MKLIIILFGSLLIAVSVIMGIRPHWFLQQIRRRAGATWFYLLAIAVRLLLGFVLIGYSEQSRFPTVFQVLGVLSIAAAAVLAVLPRHRFEQLIGWVIDRFDRWVRVGALAVCLFGAFLIVGVTPF